MNEPQPDRIERCTSCVLPRSVGRLHFDESGMCSLCQATTTSKGAAGTTAELTGDIEEILQRVRAEGRDRKYDCLVGVSGGRDSSYLLYLLTKRHKLRCLAAYYRTPFTDDVIEENVERMVKRLQVPLVRMNISQEAHRRYARKMLAWWRKHPCSELTNLLCAPCKYVNREVFKIARQNNIGTIVYGGNVFETFQFGAGFAPVSSKRHRHGLAAQLVKGALITKRGLTLLAGCPGLITALPTAVKAAILYINPHTPYLQMRYGNIRRIDYFNHEQQDETECTQVIVRELGWQLPPGCNSYWRADCSLAELKSCLFRRDIGASYMEAYLSNMVRSGVITRDEALARLAREGRVSTRRLQHASRVLEMCVDFLTE